MSTPAVGGLSGIRLSVERSSIGPTARRQLAGAVGAVLLAGSLAGLRSAEGSTIEPRPPDGVARHSRARPTTNRDRFRPPGWANRARPSGCTSCPRLLVLPGDAQAPVQPAATVDGAAPGAGERAARGLVGRQRDAGDPFGSTVIAGHVDSATTSDGFFARLKRVKQGDVVTLRAGEHRLSYKITVGAGSWPGSALADRYARHSTRTAPTGWC